MHLFVVWSLQQDPAVIGAHGKCVGSLKIWEKSGLSGLFIDLWASFIAGLEARPTLSKVCLSSLYSTFADDRLMTALSTLSLSLRYR